MSRAPRGYGRATGAPLRLQSESSKPSVSFLVCRPSYMWAPQFLELQKQDEFQQWIAHRLSAARGWNSRLPRGTVAR